MSDFSVKYSGMDDSAFDLRARTQEIRESLDKLASKMARVRGELDGATAENYDNSMAQWQLNVQDMEFLLTRAEQALILIRDNYQNTDNKLSLEWVSRTM
ncbi:WXG100 family type VII secretion target [Nocardiopsis sediminis]|uniref:ESAT-6-like protein n=1 Tax=Nocardiopsis sediminis TaxID=1778267 RepID=A0ABV8FPZ9_9ACTN